MLGLKQKHQNNLMQGMRVKMENIVSILFKAYLVGRVFFANSMNDYKIFPISNSINYWAYDVK